MKKGHNIGIVGKAQETSLNTSNMHVCHYCTTGIVGVSWNVGTYPHHTACNLVALIPYTAVITLIISMNQATVNILLHFQS